MGNHITNIHSNLYQLEYTVDIEIPPETAYHLYSKDNELLNLPYHEVKDILNGWFITAIEMGFNFNRISPVLYTIETKHGDLTFWLNNPNYEPITIATVGLDIAKRVRHALNYHKLYGLKLIPDNSTITSIKKNSSGTYVATMEISGRVLVEPDDVVEKFRLVEDSDDGIVLEYINPNGVVSRDNVVDEWLKPLNTVTNNKRIEL